MHFNKKIYCFIVGLILFFSSGYFLKSTATVIQSTNIDTYTISLNGDILNQVSGLNIKIQIKDLKADIASSVTFSSNGASSILSSVTGPEGDIYTITLALNGKIKDGKAAISGKFIQGSIFPGADLNIIKIERDGGTDITSLLTAGISFKNSKATSTSTPTPTPTPTTTSSATPNATPESEPLSPEVQDQLNHFLGDNSGDIDLSEAGSVLEDALANGELNGNLRVSGSNTFQLKPKGLNRYYAQISLEGKADGFDRFLCELSTGNDESIDLSYFKPPVSKFTLKLQEGKSYRIYKRIKIPFIPTEEGLDILKGKISSDEIRFIISCASYSTKDQELFEYLEDNFGYPAEPSDITTFDLLNYWLHIKDRENIRKWIIMYQIKYINILAPKAANVGQ